jgi:hypothetical protein
VNNNGPSLIGIAKYRESLKEQLKRYEERKREEEREYKDVRLS